ncbi:MAG: prolyl oligopeptidase family serine peptidase [Caulobacteraceae bacterium]|nr:prolyl oligopeptidase family serine peptidase [Caulobacteraceae bacterium]
MIRPVRAAMAAALAILSVNAPVSAQTPSAEPVAIYSPIRPVSETFHGVTVTDSYRWLEYADEVAVRNWAEAQNQRTRDALDASRNRASIKAALVRLSAVSGPAYSELTAAGAHVFALDGDPSHAGPVVVALNAAADPGGRRVVADPAVLDPSGASVINGFVPSPDGQRLAVVLSKTGDAGAVLRIVDVASGRPLADTLPGLEPGVGGGAVAWSRDGLSLWYVRAAMDAAKGPEVYLHRLGTPPSADTAALSGAEGLQGAARVRLDNSHGRTAIVASAQRADGAWSHFVLRPGKPAQRVAGYDDQIDLAVIGPDDGLYGLSRAAAPTGKILKLSRVRPGARLADGSVITPASAAMIETFAPIDARHLVVRDTAETGASQVRVFDLDGRGLFKLSLPDGAVNTEIAPLANGEVLYDATTTPQVRRYLRWTPATGAVRDAGLTAPGAFNFDDVAQISVQGASRDGTKVSVTLYRRRDVKPDGNLPTLLYGAGSYGRGPHALGAFERLWLDAGGVYAVASLRGDGGHGERWRFLGQGLYKQNTLDDFAAAAQALIDGGYARRERLALVGDANSGPLIGAMVIQHPGLARAVVSTDGLFDMLHLGYGPNHVADIAEFGATSDPTAFRALDSYSPYHHVSPGAYPAVMLATGGDQGWVDPKHSRKFAVILQAASNSGLPVMLRNGVPGASDQLERQVDELTFLADQLRIGAGPAPAAPTPIHFPPRHHRKPAKAKTAPAPPAPKPSKSSH